MYVFGICEIKTNNASVSIPYISLYDDDDDDNTHIVVFVTVKNFKLIFNYTIMSAYLTCESNN